MTPQQQVQMHEHVEDARRALHARNTEEGHAFASLLSAMRGAVNAQLRRGEPAGLWPRRIKRACAAALVDTRDGEIERGY